MQFSKCPVCKSKPVQPINMKCDHHPCFACAKSIMSIDHEKQQYNVETKYKITCPTCKKKTLTYDIRHLIISFTEQDQDLYCTTKYISKKPQVIVKKSNNFVQSQRLQLKSQRNSLNSSINTNINSRHPTCLLQFFCENCFKNNSDDAFMCSQCILTHQHKVRNIRQAERCLHQINQQKVAYALPTYKKELSKLLKQLGSRKQNVQSEYQRLEKQITEQFKAVYLSINKQYENLKKDMKQFYTKQIQSVKNSLSLASRLSDSLSGLQKMYKLDHIEIESMISFHNYFHEIGKAIESNKKSLSKALQSPVIIRKSIVAFIAQPLVQIKLDNTHSRKQSKLVSPVCSPRVQDYNSDGQKPKKMMKFSTMDKMGKQNSMVSPRQKISFDSLLSYV